MRGLALLLVFASGCAAKRFGPCNDTLTCEAQQRARDHEFARLVAEEPAVARLDVESVAGVLHDRKRRVLYVTAPSLVALELVTGRELWRNDAATGALFRAGKWLALAELTTEAASRQGRRRLGATVHFIDVADAARPLRSCPIELPLHPFANSRSVEVFDRAGVPHVYWSSWWHYRGGTPPPSDMVEEGRAARGCGVITVDPITCATATASLDALLFDPPSERCDVSPLYAMPAAVASTAPAMPASTDWAVRVLRQPERAAVTALVLEVRDASGAVKWTRRIGELVEEPPMP